MINKILFADDLILMSKSTKSLRKVLKMKTGDWEKEDRMVCSAKP